MQHLIRTSDFTKDEILSLFDNAREFLKFEPNDILKGKIIVTLFFENSTRTRSSFEIAAKRLGAEVVSLDVGTSSTSKGETIFDTVANINAMNPDAIIIRHSECGLPESLVGYVDCPIINMNIMKGNLKVKELQLLEMLEIQELQDQIEDYSQDLE